MQAGPENSVRFECAAWTWYKALASAGAEPLIEHAKTGMPMVLVPGGKFLAGGPGSDDGGGAPFEVELPALYIGLHTVTNAQYARFVVETRHRAPDDSGWQASAKADHPVVGVSWEDAQAYCRWGGLRLPRELEWEKAARGTDGRKYPWGKYWDENKCRHSGIKGNGTTAGVWEYGAGASPYGAYQMSGNVWEWCEDWYDAKAYERYRRGDLTLPSGGNFRVLRGGSWAIPFPAASPLPAAPAAIPALASTTSVSVVWAGWGFRPRLAAESLSSCDLRS
jgi:formylglycine-generating enzyme required for sulfatase activity